MKDLLEAGVHFGHHTRKWNPKMKPYIYGERNDIYIIDLHKTRRKVEDAYETVRQMAFTGKRFLFVGTKKQAQDAIKDAANSRFGMRLLLDADGEPLADVVRSLEIPVCIALGPEGGLEEGESRFQ